MTDKQLVIDAVSRLPEATTIEAIREEIEILAAVKRGQEAAAAGRVIPHEEVKKLVAEWSSK
ncbi:MAG TPA: hypothetical protein VNH11_25840 [Pirellulales bacterium]|nr:hypothetical protein [Pirellulales bacterium]